MNWGRMTPQLHTEINNILFEAQWKVMNTYPRASLALLCSDTTEYHGPRIYDDSDTTTLPGVIARMDGSIYGVAACTANCMPALVASSWGMNVHEAWILRDVGEMIAQELNRFCRRVGSNEDRAQQMRRCLAQSIVECETGTAKKPEE